ncbi:MAG: hypothetical protein IJU99_04675 [Lachnospiraceae bacterium]|nr:hypothetical protein [Lachnospiraceae bacterium]
MSWEEACARAAQVPRERGSIGQLSEKTLHAVCKFYLEPDEGLHEVTVEGLVADVCRADGSIVEVQTRNFDRLREKLKRFLPEHEVEVVYPLPAAKRVIWIGEDGSLSEPRRSPKKGRHTDACYELWRIKEFLEDPHLTVRLLFADMDEYRLLNGWSRDKKHGSTRYERLPGELREELVLRERGLRGGVRAGACVPGGVYGRGVPEGEPDDEADGLLYDRISAGDRRGGEVRRERPGLPVPACIGGK